MRTGLGRVAALPEPSNGPPEVREIFKRFWIDEVELKYSMSKKEGSRSQIRTELLIGD